MCHDERNGGKLHGNISPNGYGTSIIGRYGGCFEERYKEGLMHHESCAVLQCLAKVEG